MCEWYPSTLLVISENVFSPLLYYSYFGSVVPSLALALFVFISGPNKRPNRLLLLMILSFSLWVFGALVTWATEFPSYTMFFWTLINIFEPFVYYFAFHFVYSFIYQKNTPFILTVLSTVPLLPTLLLAPTNMMLTGYNLSNCDRNASEGILATYGYAIEIVYVISIISIFLFSLKLVREKDEKIKNLLITVGIVLFLASFSLGNIIEVFTENWLVGQYGLFGAPIFVAILSYIIVRYKAFELKIVGAQLLIVVLLLSVFALFFVGNLSEVRIVVSFTLMFIIGVGYVLVRSVKKEIAQREQIEQLAQRLEKANDQLKILDKMKSEFVSIASHQLRSPLTSIRGYASMLLEGSFGPLSEKAKEAISRIGESSRFMASSVEDYLNVSRIQAGNMKYEYSDFNLKDIAETIADDTRQIAVKKGLLLTFKTDIQKRGIVHADIGKTRQIIDNLVNNSLKYTPKGSITVNVSDDSKKKKIYVDISDTGIGMSQKSLDNIFGKFERASNANEVNVTGTGLGLYIARKMAREMGGEVTASSKGEGAGSMFRLELPLQM